MILFYSLIFLNSIAWAHPNTISAAHAFIRNALKYAVYPVQLISSNPAEYIKAPKNTRQDIDFAAEKINLPKLCR